MAACSSRIDLPAFVFGDRYVSAGLKCFCGKIKTPAACFVSAVQAAVISILTAGRSSEIEYRFVCISIDRDQIDRTAQTRLSRKASLLRRVISQPVRPRSSAPATSMSTRQKRRSTTARQTTPSPRRPAARNTAKIRSLGRRVCRLAGTASKERKSRDLSERIVDRLGGGRIECLPRQGHDARRSFAQAAFPFA